MAKQPKRSTKPERKPTPQDSESGAGGAGSELPRTAEAAEWHRRHQEGRFEAASPYGSSQDQWACDRQDVQGRPGVLPAPAAGSAGRGQRASFDTEPYRPERMYGFAPGGPPAAFDSGDAQGPASGRGGWSRGPRRLPRGYERSDERIREDVCERLARVHWLDVGDVSVTVSQGVVSLEGTVPVRGMKHAIEDIADDCVGVLDVDNRIKVSRSVAGRGTEPAGLAWPEDDAVLLNGRQR